jgi:DNA-binding transcriptional LysR family regulator
MADIDRVLRSNLKLRHLQLLVVLDQFRHLGRAAEFLSLTQPAVSKTLAEIERLFGASLFDRSTRGTEPTPIGAAVVRFARSVLADYERTRDELAAVAAGATGPACAWARWWWPRAGWRRRCRLFKQQQPQTTVLVEEGDLMRLLPRLRGGELDLIVGRLEPGHAAPDLDTEPLYDEPMVLVARPRREGTRAAAAPLVRAHHRQRRRSRAHPHRRAGQAARGSAGRDRLQREFRRLVRRGGQARLRRHHSRARRRQAHRGDQAADRRGGLHHAVEFPERDARAQDRPGARGGLRGGVQAREQHAAVGPRDRGARRARRLPAGRDQHPGRAHPRDR